jgi:NitT/TauT family transport system permease protein
LAIATCSSELLDALISPIIRIIRATPVASFIILALLWMGKDNVPILMSMLMVIPVVWENITAQYQATDRDLLEMAQAYKLSRWKKFRYIYVPSAFPGFLSGCLSAMGLAWKSGIAAEVLSQPKQAIGSNLYYSKLYLETPDLFAWTAVVVILSMCIERLIKFRLFRGVRNEDK